MDHHNITPNMPLYLDSQLLHQLIIHDVERHLLHLRDFLDLNLRHINGCPGDKRARSPLVSELPPEPDAASRVDLRIHGVHQTHIKEFRRDPGTLRQPDDPAILLQDGEHNHPCAHHFHPFPFQINP